MRYLLLALGLLATVGGGFYLVSKHPGADGPAMEFRNLFLVIAGVICFAVGAATIDIVEAIKSRRN